MTLMMMEMEVVIMKHLGQKLSLSQFLVIIHVHMQYGKNGVLVGKDLVR